MLSTDQLDYELPKDRIATRPAIPRESARLLVTSRNNPSRITHARVRDLPSLLNAGDLLVRNTTPVIAARLEGTRTDSGGRVTGLFLESLSPDTWRCLLKANSKLRPGTEITLSPHDPSAQPLHITLDTKNDDASWLVTLKEPPSDGILHLLESLGLTPLPPYILAARRQHDESVSEKDDRAWYHTVFEDHSTLDQRGASVAAPTAGLHITEELLAQLASAGVTVEDVVLHVGEGTFKPVETGTLEDHPMHEERFLVPQRTLDAISRTRRQGGKIVALGTTTTRALESIGPKSPAEQWNSTSLLISPGYTFSHIDALMTNFHLPRSTLLAMVSALFPNGIDDLLPIYQEAIERGYRFYSYGDAMLILP